MLILTRRIGERIMIGEPPNQIIITVLPYGPGSGIRLGFEAPKNIPIVREEIIDTPSGGPDVRR